VQDFKYALRMIAKNPLFSAVAIFTLAVGIGANAAIYTVVDAVLLEPLPFRDSHELTQLWTRNDEQNHAKYMVSPMDFDDWRTMNTTFESMAAYWPTAGTVTETDGNPTRVRVVYTTEDFFDVMGASSLVGRAFTDEDGPGSTQVAILSHGFWQRRFGADPDVIGQSLVLDGQPLQIVGVIRSDQTFPDDTDLWTNMTWSMQIQSRLARWMSAVGRLNDGTDLDLARRDLAGVALRIAQDNPGTNRGWTVTLARVQDEMTGDTRMALLVLLGATGLIVLIACANVANLLLSRAEARAREIAVRVAFGASRARLARQLVTESLALAGAGASLGLVLAQVGVRVLVGMAPVTLPRSDSIALDGTVLAVVAGVSVLTGVLFGLAPIGRMLRSEVHDTLREGARGSSSGARARRVQGAFVVGQFALALMLVVGAGLLVRSFQNIRAIDTGFAPSGVLTAELDLPTSVAESDQDVINFYEQLERSLAEVPEVQVAGDASTLPLAEALDYSLPFTLLDRDLPVELEPRAFQRPVAPGFFEAMQIPIVEGRGFESYDRVDAPGVVVVNESFARRFFGEDSPLGERFGDMRNRYGPLGAIHMAGDIRESEIVGVVKDVKYDGLRTDPVPAIYFSGLQTSVRRRTLAIRTLGDPAALIPTLREQVEAMSPNVALTNIQRMTDVLSAAQSRDRFSTLLLTLFGIVALLLASVGVYGVLAYAVEQRRGELGIRMALGANKVALRAMVLRDGARLVGMGLVAGTVGALGFAGLIATQLFGVDPRDPVIFAAAASALLLVGIAASLLPAWRATTVDPLVAMRAE
jgi:putative ABC transport system permease protein